MVDTRRIEKWPQEGVGASFLINSKYNILLDSYLLRTNSFYHFYNEWICNSINYNKPLYVLCLSKKDFDSTCNLSGVAALLCTDVINCGKTLKPIKGDWIYISNSPDSIDIIRQSIRNEKIFIRAYHLSESGLLQSYKPLTDSNKRKSNISSNKNEPIKKFNTPTSVCSIRKVDFQSISVPKTGDYVYDSHKNIIYLREEFISNPQSITYQTNHSGYQAKVYQKKWLCNSYFRDKVIRMLAVPIKMDGICWPVDLLYNINDEFVGILVPEAEGHQLKPDVMSQSGLETYFSQWDRWTLTHVTRIILEKIAYLQERNVIFGLINPSSIFVKDVNHIYFTEMDSLQIDGFPILSFEGVMQAPELQGTKQEVRLYTKEQDNYEIALLTFMILMPGKFPYNKGNNKTISESIKKMSFAFRYGGKKNSEHGVHEYFGLWRFVWSHLGDDLKFAFYNTFQGGQAFSSPETRKNAKYWLSKVKKLEDELLNPYDKESLKIFPRTFKRYSGSQTIKCVKCGIDHPSFYYLYPEKRICNSCLGKPSDTYFVCKSCNMEYYYDFSTLFKYENLVKTKGFKMPTHCPYCRSDKDKCKGTCGKMYPTFRLNKEGLCPDCAELKRNVIVKSYKCSSCGSLIRLTQGEVDFYRRKGFDLPTRCTSCRSKRQNKY